MNFKSIVKSERKGFQEFENSPCTLCIGTLALSPSKRNNIEFGIV